MRLQGMTPQGEWLTLGVPARLILQSNEEAPADDVTAVLPVRERPPILSGLRVLGESGSLLLEGIIDEQTLSLGQGYQLRLTARSRAALLLDNQAMPQEYRAPSLPLLFARHARPYGFSGYLGNAASVAGLLRVEKGMSEWAVLERFCRDFLRVTPVLTPEGVLDASGLRRGNSLYFSNHGGIPYMALEERRQPYRLLSQLTVRTEGSVGYDQTIHCALAREWGVSRRRFWDGAGETAPLPRGEEMLKRARERAWRLVLRCPGVIRADTGAPAAVEDPLLGCLEKLTVCGKRITVDETGAVTQVELRAAG